MLQVVVALLLLGQTLEGQTGRRLALMIGISGYENFPSVPKALDDAEAIGNALTKVGFKVTVLKDSDYNALMLRLNAFTDQIKAGDTIFVYYAGHGVQANGRNFILPQDFPASAAELEHHAVPVDYVIQQVAVHSPRLRIFVIDACRNNPFGSKSGLAKMETRDVQGGTFIAFAAGENQVAADGLFAKHLAVAIQKPGITLSAAFIEVRKEVMQSSNQRQNVFVNDGELEQFSFLALVPGAPSTGTQPQTYYSLLSNSVSFLEGEWCSKLQLRERFQNEKGHIAYIFNSDDPGYTAFMAANGQKNGTHVPGHILVGKKTVTFIPEDKRAMSSSTFSKDKDDDDIIYELGKNEDVMLWKCDKYYVNRSTNVLIRR